MNKKDLNSLMEAYGEIASMQPTMEEPAQCGVMVTTDVTTGAEEVEELKKMEHKKTSMVQTRLRSIIVSANQALLAIENGATIEPWMQDLITISADNIVSTANTLLFKKQD
jgi:hypothetical protein